MRLDPAGLPFIGGALLLALISGAAVAWLLAIPFVVLGLFFVLLLSRSPPDLAGGSGRRVVAR
jgi:ABC-type tungstate transport system substrate-binding protein